MDLENNYYGSQGVWIQVIVLHRTCTMAVSRYSWVFFRKKRSYLN